MTSYVAPYTRVFTVAHIAADGTSPPATRCGQPLSDGEIWLPVTLLPGERICPECEAGTQPEQAGMW